MVDADLKNFFRTVDHDKLMSLLTRKASDGRVLRLMESILKAGCFAEGRLFPTRRVLRLIESFLTRGVMDGLDEWTPTADLNTSKPSSDTSVFRSLDGLIRRRCRRVLLKRHRKHDHNGRGSAHYRWPNTYFAEHGLFSMEAAHVRIRQSAAR